MRMISFKDTCKLFAVLSVLEHLRGITATCYSSWTKKVNLNDSVLHNMLFESTVMCNFDCAKKCGSTELCTYYGFEETQGTCKGFKERGNYIGPASNLHIWQKSCGVGYKYMTEPRWCIKAYDKFISNDQADIFCTSKKSRLAVINSAEKLTFAYNYTKALYPGIEGYTIGVKYNRANGKWWWSTGEQLDTSLSWAAVFRNHPSTDCAVLWNGKFDDYSCTTNSNRVGVLCEKL